MDRNKSKQAWLWFAFAVAGLAALGISLLSATDESVSRVSPLKSARAAAPPKILGSADTKPICSQIIVPVGDCIPQHLANLPPDPGPEGMKSIEGIDADKDGVRDDLQRIIVLNWGHSERAVQALRLIAKNAQLRIQLGDVVTREEALPIATEMMKSVDCYSRSVDAAIRKRDALSSLGATAANTEERFLRKAAFEYKAAHQLYDLPPRETPLTELCGYDPAALPN